MERTVEGVFRGRGCTPGRGSEGGWGGWGMDRMDRMDRTDQEFETESHEEHKMLHYGEQPKSKRTGKLVT